MEAAGLPEARQPLEARSPRDRQQTITHLAPAPPGRRRDQPRHPGLDPRPPPLALRSKPETRIRNQPPPTSPLAGTQLPSPTGYTRVRKRCGNRAAVHELPEVNSQAPESSLFTERGSRQNPPTGKNLILETQKSEPIGSGLDSTRSPSDGEAPPGGGRSRWASAGRGGSPKTGREAKNGALTAGQRRADIIQEPD